MLLNIFPHSNPQILRGETQGKMLCFSLERNERPSLGGTAAANSWLSSSSISAKFCSANDLFCSGWAKYIPWLSPQEKFLQSLLWLSRHYYNMHLNCLIHEPTIKPLQSWSIKSLFQRLLKFCVWIKNWCCCWERLEIYLCFNVVTQCDFTGRIRGQKKILIILQKGSSEHFRN